MEDHWEAIKMKTLMQMTFLGSHNSGNFALSSSRLCASDYRYKEYVADVSTKIPLTEGEFDKRFIPWNLNQEVPLLWQLEYGVRFFHFKICNFGESGEENIDLHNVFHQHRGYTTHETLADTLADISAFLAENQREIVVLGFNNLHNNGTHIFSDADVLALSNALEEFLHKPKLISRQELLNSTIASLIEVGKRIVIFMGGGAKNTRLPDGVVPSAQVLRESWNEKNGVWGFESFGRMACS